MTDSAAPGARPETETAPALVVTLDHVLADGVSGLAVLGALCDPGMPPAENPAISGTSSMLARSAR